MENLYQLMALEKGVIAFVGGGGKTTCMYTLAKELKGQGYSVIVTTTTKMQVPNEDKQLLLQPTPEEVKVCLRQPQISVVAQSVRNNKLIGIEEEQVEMLKGLADFILVEADGAKRMPVKVPRDYEPVIPRCANQVVGLVGLSALGHPIGQVCCRGEEVAAFLGKSEEELLTVEDLYQLIVSTCGLAKGTESKKFQVVLNQMDVCEQANDLSGVYLSEWLRLAGIERVTLSALKELRWKQLKGGERC